MGYRHFGVIRSKSVSAWRLCQEAATEFSRDRGDLAAAALAFYSLLSIAPLMIVAVAVAGLLLSAEAAKAETLGLLRETMGATAAETVSGWVEQAHAGGAIGSVVGVGLTLFAASRLADQLREVLNQVWNIEVSASTGFRNTVLDYLMERAFALLVVLAVGPLLLAVVISRALLSGLGEFLFASSALKGLAFEMIQLSFALVLVTMLSTLIFRFIPDRNVGWKACFHGGVVTSLLFNVGNYFVGLYLGRASVETYGLAG
ncbi:MAG: hypothetical protein RJA70_3146, partial [Pseudomonadota bacterium]